MKIMQLIALSLLLVSADVFAKTVLITGSNRGIGLELARQYGEAGWDVIATTRKPKKSDDLQKLSKQFSNIKIEKLDVTNVDQIGALAKKYEGKPIDVLINNAGVMGDYDKQKMGQFDYGELDWVIDVNTKGPLRMAMAFKDNVEASEEKKIVILASALGSVTMAPFIRDMYWYKISKVGMSVAMASLQVDLKKAGSDITVLRLGPGMVKTDMLKESGSYDRGIPASEAVAGMREVIEKATPNMAKKTYNYDGKPVPN